MAEFLGADSKVGTRMTGQRQSEFSQLQDQVEAMGERIIELERTVEMLAKIAGDESGGANFLKDNHTGLQVFKGKVQFMTDVYNAAGTKVIN